MYFIFSNLAPARYAIATPSPVETNGFEVTPNTCPEPPVAKTVAFEQLESTWFQFLILFCLCDVQYDFGSDRLLILNPIRQNYSCLIPRPIESILVIGQELL